VEKNIDVLVLDDEIIVCKRLKEFLEQKNITVETFTDSEQAISRLKQKAFDVVVTDMKMPGQTGMDVLRFTKSTRPSTQVIIISAYSVMDNLREAEAIGTYHYLTKPFQLSALHALIKKAAKHAKK
jgi:two-component system response regulator AtoC